MRDLFRTRRMWRPRGELKDSYDVVIVGGGSHGLATAYYLCRHGITDVCVLEKSYIGSGAAGRNTTILRSNYRTPAMVLREAEDRFLVLFGSALGEYMWTAVADAATHLGASPVGVDALEALSPPAVEAVGEEAGRA